MLEREGLLHRSRDAGAEHTFEVEKGAERMVEGRISRGERVPTTLRLYDYGARWYDPQMGRFLQPDPIVPGRNDPQGLNRYAYVRNNPVNRVDPSGNISLSIGLALGTFSYSSGIGFGWDWGPSLGLGFSTGSYGNGLASRVQSVGEAAG